MKGKLYFFLFYFFDLRTCSIVKEDGQPEPSYQYLSPNLMERHPNIFSSSTSHTNVIVMTNLKLWNCLPMMQAKVGPTMEPGRGSSLIPAVHKSMSSGLSYSSE